MVEVELMRISMGGEQNTTQPYGQNMKFIVRPMHTLQPICTPANR